jgi:hypothetical protein
MGGILIALVGGGWGQRVVGNAIESGKVKSGDDGLFRWAEGCKREPRGFVFATRV